MTLRRYKFRKITQAERDKLADLIRTVQAWAIGYGVTIRIEVQNKRNSNGYWIEWVPETEMHRGQVKVTRYISKAWADAHGYRW